jgi:hypothetical protein
MNVGYRELNLEGPMTGHGRALPVGTCRGPSPINRFPQLANGRFQQDPFAVAEIVGHQIPHTRAGACKRAEAAIRNVSGPDSRPQIRLDQDGGS